jgi:NitT/TauT family transport system substrate-binding protein
MKKCLISVALLILFLSMMACSRKEQLRILVPSGSPAIAQMYLQEQTNQYRVDIVNGPDPLVAAFLAQTRTHDIIFAPTNLGAKLATTGMNFWYAGAIVWGNYYIVGQGHSSFTLYDLAGKSIIVFGQNQTSDIIIRYLLNALSIDVSIIYVDSVATATAMFLADASTIVMVAEPSLSVIRNQMENVQIIDLQTNYMSITGQEGYPQSGVFVHQSLSKSKINKFLEDLELGIQKVNDDPHAAGLLAETLKMGFSADIITMAIPNSHLNYVSALASKTALEIYFSLILELNASLIGGKLPEQSFYYQP